MSIFVLTADLNPAMNDEMDLGNRFGGLRFMDNNSGSIDSLDSIVIIEPVG